MLEIIAISFNMSCGSGEKRFRDDADLIATSLSLFSRRAWYTVEATPEAFCVRVFLAFKNQRQLGKSREQALLRL